MKSQTIRQKFFDFFIQKQHEKVESSSLIPAQDPTLLFANAGMNQFKDVFLGIEKRSYSRAVSIQKCVRAGGKHNDLDNVGFTKRHLTFFEMMGNFSFGDYFKKNAISHAWEFLTKDMGIDASTIHASVHHTDDEAFDLWHTRIGLPKEKIHRLGDKDNFWQMGDIGPCGPCSELFVDRGPSFGCPDAASCGPACDCDRFLEVWNLVFMQFDRQADGSQKELTHKGVDTGMGFERLCAIMQDKDSVFEIDMFQEIIKKTEQLCGKAYATVDPELKAAFHVLADHIRSTTFLIADGCAPSNDGRGYVLRKIIRRAALFAQKLSYQSLFPELSAAVVDQMKDIYPNLETNRKLIYSVLKSETERFAANLVRGTAILEKQFTESTETKTITGTQAFKLYDTYGFPVELITATARERGYTVDLAAYETLMEKQKSSSGKKDAIDPLDHIELDESIVTEFTGYKELETTSPIVGLIVDNTVVTTVPAGSTCFVMMEQSPFFIVGGGQVPDHGWLTIDNNKVPLQSVRYIQKRIAAEIKAPVDLTVGDMVTATVHKQRRFDAMKNHTGTHLLQSALIELFGNQIKQSGSLVDPDYLRFDFTYHENLSSDDIARVENLVNEKIRENTPVTIDYTTLREATKQGAIAFFGDKYNPEEVRVVNVGDFSAELCGGTHVERTGDIGTFKITEVSALAAGHRRIVAVTGPKAIAHYQTLFAITKGLSQELSVKLETLPEVVTKQKEELHLLQKEYALLQKKLLHAQIPELQKKMQTINSVPSLCAMIEGSTVEQMREVIATLAAKTPGFYFMGSSNDNKVLFVAHVSPEYRTTIKTKNLGAWLLKEHNLRGGGKPGDLQGGGAKFESNFESKLFEWILSQ